MTNDPSPRVEYPRPDRSDFHPRFEQTSDDESVDIGWAEGAMRDGRPWRAECWTDFGFTYLTYNISNIGLEGETLDNLRDLLAREGLIEFIENRSLSSVGPWTDPSGNELLSLTIAISDVDGPFARNKVGGIRPYLARWGTLGGCFEHLTRCLEHLADETEEKSVYDDSINPYLVVDAGGAYVQFCGELGTRHVRWETVGDRFLPPDRRLTETQVRKLVERGFALDEDVGNFAQRVPLYGDDSQAAIADQAVCVLREVYGCPEDAETKIELYLGNRPRWPRQQFP